ncbi:MAG: hypothetical protein JXM70_02600, partial [Pirellulales bacterium]|nr:hypothetical protein [Pirellulales bacterium]
MKPYFLTTFCMACMSVFFAGNMPVSATDTIDIGSRLELFVDDYLIDKADGVTRELHSPQRRNVAIRFDKPWEGGACGYVTVFQDDDRCRMYYRAQDIVGPYSKFPNMYGPEVVGYAESKDGINWSKPKLNLYHGEFISRYKKKFNVPRDNNIVWLGTGRLVDSTHNFSPFKDTNPNCKPEERYKAFGRIFDKGNDGLLAFKSPDAIHWSLMQDNPVITKGRNDTHPAIFWDSVRGRYVEYHRQMRGGYRDILTATSSDFLHWTEPVFVEYGGAKPEHLYSPKVLPYFRAPHIFLAFPMRLVSGRVWVKEHPEHEISDGVFLSSRDGLHF